MTLAAVYYIMRGAAGDGFAAHGQNDIYQVPVILGVGHINLCRGIARF